MKKEDKILENQAWGHMEGILDKEMPVQKTNRRGLFWWIGLCTLLLVGIFAYSYFDTASDQAIVSGVAENQDYAKNIEVNNEPKGVTDIKSNKVNGSNQDESKVALSEMIQTDVKEEELHSGTQDTENTSKEGLDNIDKNNSPSSISISLFKKEKFASQNKNRKNLDGFDTEFSRKKIKEKLSQIYSDDYSSENFEEKGETIVYDDLKRDSKSLDKRTQYEALDALPLSTIDLKNNSNKFELEEDLSVDLIKAKDNWSFAGFGSYQYLNKYFTGYDIGLVTEYDRGGRFSLDVKVGFERIRNTNEPVLSDALVGVVIPGTDNVSFELDDGSILSSTKDAGFKLNDVLLSFNNLMLESTLSYKVSSKFSFSSGIGFKRLLSVGTRSISGLDSDAIGLNSDFDQNKLDSDALLNSPSINRNKFYIPFETQYSLFSKMTLGIGAQLFVNRNFKIFDEKKTSFYARVRFKF